MTTPASDLNITYEERDAYLFAHVSASEISPALGNDYLVDIARRARELNLAKIVVVRDIPSVMNPVDVFTGVGNVVADYYGLRVAFVNPYPELREALEFGATVGNNRGAMFAVFDDEKTAVDWLFSR